MTVGRPREFDIEQALAKATEQFWAYGYEATSLQDLLRVTGLSKSSLYQTFGSKRELFLKCIDHYQQQKQNEFLTSLQTYPTALEFIQALLDGILLEAKTNAPRKGCLVSNTCNEVCIHDPEINKAILGAINKIDTVMHKAITNGKKDGSIKSKLNTNDLVSFLMANLNGLRTMIKAGAQEKNLSPVKEIILNTLS